MALNNQNIRIIELTIKFLYKHHLKPKKLKKREENFTFLHILQTSN